MTANDVIRIAAAEVGTTEYPPNSNKVKYNTWYYGQEVSGSAYPWCVVFVQWCFDQAGDRTLLPVLTASCGTLKRYSEQAGQWVKGSYQPGDVVIMNFSGTQDTEHMGIVESVQDGAVVTIEGNTSSGNSGSQDNGGGVYRKTRSLRYVLGAHRPKFVPIETEEDEDMDVTRFKELWLEMRQELQDNDASDWSQQARDWATSNGLVEGDGSSYMWEDVMTREQFITVLYRFAQIMGKA